MKKGGTVYILTNKYNKVLYIGVISDLMARLIQHKEKFYPRSFTARYNVHQSVYYENFNSIVEAMERERFLKGKVRKFKIQLKESFNPTWRDLSYEVLTW